MWLQTFDSAVYYIGMKYVQGHFNGRPA